jgi:hypothetical protein
MKAIEGAVVGGGTEQGQADVPAHEQIARQVPFELAVGTGVGPGADDLGLHEDAYGKGRRRARSGLVVIVATGRDDGRWIVAAGEADERMAGTLYEQGLIDEGADPGEDEGEKAAEQGLHDGGQRGEVRGGGGGRGW